VIGVFVSRILNGPVILGRNEETYEYWQQYTSLLVQKLACAVCYEEKHETKLEQVELLVPCEKHEEYYNVVHA